MSTTLKRTSMALDEESLQNLESLSKDWKVSKAEVLRRSLKIAKEKNDTIKLDLTPLEALEWLRKNGISQDQAEEWRAEIKAERMAWVGPWEKHVTP